MNVDRQITNLALRLSLIGDHQSLRTSSKAFLDEAASAGSEPEQFYVYLIGVMTAWYLLALASGLLMVGLAYAGFQVAGQSGRTSGVVLGVGLAAFCSYGAVDATIRSLFVYFASRRYKTLGELDPASNRAMRVGRVRYPIWLLQVVFGVAAALLALDLL